MTPSLPLGVDILEWKKARSFYETHRLRLSEWLTDAERKFVEEKKHPHQAFAVVFAAKEAAYKAIGKNGLGPDAIRRVSLVPRSLRKFSVAKNPSLEVTVRHHRRHVVAFCHPVKVG
jgi:phosphopantetheine--protein transferase-like protein